jgi:hypothetical protein
MLKTIIAALIVASAATALASKANAGPTGQPEATYYIDRASQNHDGGTGN